MAATPAVNITIPQGADFSQVFTAKETDGSVRNLTDYTGSAKIKKHPGSSSSSDFTVGITSATGKVSIAMTSGVSVGLNPGRYVYDVRLVSPSGSVSRMVEGMALVTAGITT